jgi:hypothetical protein
LLRKLLHYAARKRNDLFSKRSPIDNSSTAQSPKIQMRDSRLALKKRFVSGHRFSDANSG